MIERSESSWPWQVFTNWAGELDRYYIDQWLIENLGPEGAHWLTMHNGYLFQQQGQAVWFQLTWHER